MFSLRRAVTIQENWKVHNASAATHIGFGQIKNICEYSTDSHAFF